MPLILIADDAAFARRMVKKALKEDSYEILEASNGKECLEMITTYSPDCIVLDLLMPELNGFEVLKELHKQDSNIPVIVLSADIQDTTRSQCKELGAFNMLQKPLKPAEIREAISEVLKVVEIKVVDLTDEQLDILSELINIGVCKAGKILNEMIESHINLQVPFLKVLSTVEIEEVLSQCLGYDPLSSVKLDFSGSFTGTAKLVFPTESVTNLVSVLTGEGVESPDLDTLKIGTLTEVGNIVINSVMGSMSNMLEQRMYYTIPTYAEEYLEHLVPMGEPNNSFLLFKTIFDVEELQFKGDMILFFKVGSIRDLLTIIENF